VLLERWQRRGNQTLLKLSSGEKVDWSFCQKVRFQVKKFLEVSAKEKGLIWGGFCEKKFPPKNKI